MVRWEERVTDQAARSLEKSEVERREERGEKERQLLWQVQEPVKPQGQTGAKLLYKRQPLYNAESHGHQS